MGNGAPSLVAIDLSAAFDTVDHDILLDVMNKCFGVEGDALRWCESYLRPRQFHVQIKDACSRPCDLQFSVPQGSAAGPILYTAYASTMRYIIPEFGTNISGYADDHVLYNTFPAGNSEAEHDTLRRQERCLESIKTWMSENRLQMNDTKTEFILFGHRAQLSKCECTSLRIGDCSVDKTEGMKYLGIWIDNELTFKKHIVRKARLASLNLRNIRQLRCHLSRDSCQTLVQALVLSHLDYGNASLVDLPASTLRPAQLVQNSAAKLILGHQRSDSATEALRELHWLPIYQRCKFKLLLLVYKCLHNQAPVYLRDLLVIREAPRNTRSSSIPGINLVVPRTSRSTFASRSFSAAGPNYWNKLPSEIRTCNTVLSFRKKLKTYLFVEHFNLT